MKILLGTIALYVIIWLGVSVTAYVFESSSRSLQRRAVELGEQQAPLPKPAMKPLHEACAGKLAAGDPRSIALWVARLDEVPDLEQDYWHVDRTLLGVVEVVDRLQLSDRHFAAVDVAPAGIGDVFAHYLNPYAWAQELPRTWRGNPELRHTHYLVAARYASVKLPVARGQGYTAGEGEFGARVLSFPDGAVLCEGRGRVRVKETVRASGRSQFEADANDRDLVPFVFTEAVVQTPLADVCEAGGPELCKLTGHWVPARER